MTQSYAPHPPPLQPSQLRQALPAKRRQRVLLVDDDRLQLKLSALRLRRAGFIVTTASGAREALQLAQDDPPDAVLSDVIMGDVDGFGLCRQLREDAQLDGIPILLLSAHYADLQGKKLASQVGASALVLRTPGFDAELLALREALAEPTSGEHLVARDVSALHLRTNASEVAKLAGAARTADDRYRALFENATDTISVLSRSGIILEANERWSSALGVPAASLVGKHLLDLASRAGAAADAELDAAIARGSGHVNAVAFERPDQTTVYLDFTITVLEATPAPLVLAIGRDVTERLLAAQELAVAEDKYRSLVERMPEVVWTASEGGIAFVTSNIEALTGFSATELYAADRDFWRQRVHHDDQASFAEVARCAQSESFDVQYRWRRKDGTWVWLRSRTSAIYERGGARYTDGLTSDVTQRRLLEESLRQSQKMDALGQLTGGIAHDFNNILAVILGNSQFLIEAMREGDPKLVDAEEIRFAAERGASLTRQLLAFSRRQVLEFQDTDLNAVVAGMERLLRRMIVANIKMNVVLGDALGRVRVDAGQIEQVLMNLAVNARDAMPGGGKLTIETANVDFGVDWQVAGTQMPAGHYVMIAVTDTGVGMDAATQQRIFEPFFTTKDVGRGTGLGLATCHGIVTQCGGCIGVSSELGAGAVFKLFLPRIDGPTIAPVPRTFLASSALGGTETVLLVEDDPQLRAAIRRMLVAQGYKVVVALAGDAAAVAKLHAKEITLLLTDVVMPTLSGPEVAHAVIAVVPQVRVLFMSGQTDQLVAQSSEPNQVSQFVQKPFSPNVLLRKVRETLTQ